MAARQTKITAAKAAVSSPAQPSKAQTSSFSAPPASLTSTQPQASLPIQPPSEMLTMKDLQAALLTLTDNIERSMEKNMERNFEKFGDELEKKIVTHTEEQIKGVTGELGKIKEIIETHNTVIREDIVEAFRGVWDYTLRVEEKVDGVEQQLEKKMQEIKSVVEDQAIMAQYNQMMWAVRIRGLKEANQTQEDLRRIFGEALAVFINEGVQDLSWQIDRIYRVNSWIARQRNLPRDILIYFVTRRFRNHVLTISYNKKLMVAGQEVVIMKEIPPKMLRARKDYAFLVDELKKRGLQYRWEAPAGLSLLYQGVRYRLNSIWKAKDFFVNVLKAGEPPSPTPKTTEPHTEVIKEQKAHLQFEDSQPLAATGVDKGDLLDLAERSLDIFQPL